MCRGSRSRASVCNRRMRSWRSGSDAMGTPTARAVMGPRGKGRLAPSSSSTRSSTSRSFSLAAFWTSSLLALPLAPCYDGPTRIMPHFITMNLWRRNMVVCIKCVAGRSAYRERTFGQDFGRLVRLLPLLLTRRRAKEHASTRGQGILQLLQLQLHQPLLLRRLFQLQRPQ